MERRLFLLGLLPLVACACDDDKKHKRDHPDISPVAPAPLPEPPKPDLVEFRVLGDLGAGVLIRHSNSFDGLTQVTSGLPYFASFQSLRENLFISLEASAVGLFGFIQVQILVNGILFREATASGFDPKVLISGNHRRTIPTAAIKK